MIIPADELPIHQNASPLSQVADGHPDAFERYSYCGQSLDGDIFFAVTLGVYPNRSVVDASVSVLCGGIQRTVHTSGRLGADHAVTQIGPVTLEVLDPLRSHRISVDARGLGMIADLDFDATTPAVETPGSPEFTQRGSWTGTITVDDTTHDISPDHHAGCRRRSWGISPLGCPGTAADAAPPLALPRRFALWAALCFDDDFVSMELDEASDGYRIDESAFCVGSSLDAQPVRIQRIDYDICWAAGTRWISHATLTAGRHCFELEATGTFLMKGLGHTDTAWPHGAFKGELVVGSDSWRAGDLDPGDVSHLHARQVVRARWVDPSGHERAGVGFLEHLALGEHLPTGLTGFTDPAGTRP